MTLGACSTNKVVTKPVLYLPDIPITLLEPCREPKINYMDNQALVHGIVQYRAALRACNADKASLKAWELSIHNNGDIK